MGLLAKIGGFISKVAPVLPIPGAGIIGKIGGVVSKIGVKKAAVIVGAGAGFEAGSALVRRGVGGGGGGMAGGFAGGMPDVCAYGPDGHKYRLSKPRAASAGGRWVRCRPRGQGLSARDIRGAQKVARVVHAFGWKPKMAKRKRGRH